MSTDIFNKRWHGIEGFGTATVPNLAVRVKTAKNGPWQSLTPRECALLVDIHNAFIKRKVVLAVPGNKDLELK